MISCTYIPIVIMPYHITVTTIAVALLFIFLRTVVLLLFLKFIKWYLHHNI